MYSRKDLSSYDTSQRLPADFWKVFPVGEPLLSPVSDWELVQPKTQVVAARWTFQHLVQLSRVLVVVHLTRMFALSQDFC